MTMVWIYGVEGRAPDGTLVSQMITAGVHLPPPEIKEVAEQMVRENVRRACPGVTGIRTVLDWTEYDMPDPEDS